MIRDICVNDFQAVADIYNHYIINTVITFEVLYKNAKYLTFEKHKSLV